MTGDDRPPFDRGRPWGGNRKRLRAVSAKRAADKPRRVHVRELLYERDHGRCLIDPRRILVGAGPCRGVWTPHHLLKASAGGAYELDNLETLCAGHNTWVEDNPELAQALGLVVLRGKITPAEALARRNAAGLH